LSARYELQPTPDAPFHWLERRAKFDTSARSAAASMKFNQGDFYEL